MAGTMSAFLAAEREKDKLVVEEKMKSRQGALSPGRRRPSVVEVVKGKRKASAAAEQAAKNELAKE